MKNTTNLFGIATVLLLSFAVMTSCSKEDDASEAQAYVCETCPSTPEAKPEYDQSSKGIYKGILIGSSGTIKFNVANNNTDITATLTIDETTILLTSSITWEDGQPYVAPFIGDFNGQTATVNFYVEADGDNAQILSSNIPGHPNAVFVLVKETSNALIEGYEGTYTKSNSVSGTFNVLVSKTLGKWGGIAREDGSSEVDDIHGSISQSGVIYDDNGRQIGTLSGETISGSFSESNGTTVTISAYRTL